MKKLRSSHRIAISSLTYIILYQFNNFCDRFMHTSCTSLSRYNHCEKESPCLSFQRISYWYFTNIFASLKSHSQLIPFLWFYPRYLCLICNQSGPTLDAVLSRLSTLIPGGFIRSGKLIMQANQPWLGVQSCPSFDLSWHLSRFRLRG